MRIALAQTYARDSIEEGLESTYALMSSASQLGAEVILFPEGHLTSYVPQYPMGDISRFSMQVDDLRLQEIRYKAKELKVVTVISIYLRENQDTFSAALTFDVDGELSGISRKCHITRAPLFYEADYICPGNYPIQVIQTSVGRLGVVVCFDRHFPESFRACALQQADIVLIPTANVFGEPLEFFEWELKVPARQNLLPIAMCNRVGLEGEMRFCGRSILIGPEGNIDGLCGDYEELIVLDVDTTDLVKRREKHPMFSLFRAEAFDYVLTAGNPKTKIENCSSLNKRPE